MIFAFKKFTFSLKKLKMLRPKITEIFTNFCKKFCEYPPRSTTKVVLRLKRKNRRKRRFEKDNNNQLKKWITVFALKMTFWKTLEKMNNRQNLTLPKRTGTRNRFTSRNLPRKTGSRNRLGKALPCLPEISIRPQTAKVEAQNWRVKKRVKNGETFFEFFFNHSW